jgi:hypothetical protein
MSVRIFTAIMDKMFMKFRNYKANGYGHNLESAVISHWLCVLHPSRSGCRSKRVHLSLPLRLPLKPGFGLNGARVLMWCIPTSSMDHCHLFKTMNLNNQNSEKQWHSQVLTYTIADTHWSKILCSILTLILILSFPFFLWTRFLTQTTHKIFRKWWHNASC